MSKKIIVFGNSGSGKSTLAKHLAIKDGLAHLDLDTIAWQAVTPPERLSISASKQAIDSFLTQHQNWIIEGCYTDLLELVTYCATQMIFLNLPIDACIDNAKNRPWEPHKYASKSAQDANVDMLINWISQYDKRKDTFSKIAHKKLFEAFKGEKVEYYKNKRYSG
jgi:adenylate kinase family enzyme